MLRLRRHKSVSDPVAVVNRFVDAANRHDAAGIAKCLHPDFESIQPVYPSRNFRGSDQVRRNWQAIFTSEPGFRLSLVRSAASDGTVWVELHGAGGAVEVAGVFIMGVEDDLVRWARVYSAVVEQPAPVIEESVDSPDLAVVASTPQDEAEELRRMIEAGREAAGLTDETELADLPDTDVPDTDVPDADEVDSEVDGEVDGADEAEVATAEDAEADDEESPGDGAEVEDPVNVPVDVPVDGGGEAEATTSVDDDGSAELTDPVMEVVDIVLAPDTASEEAGTDTAEETPDASATATAGDEDESVRSDEMSPGVQAAVAEVQALAEVARPRRSRNRKRAGRPDTSATTAADPQDKPETDAGEVEDATRVRAAARAATTKAASQAQQKEPGTGGPRKPRNKGNR